MKKKLLMYFLMLMLAFSFAACSSDDDDSSSKRSERDKDDEDDDDEDEDEDEDDKEDKKDKKDKDKDKDKDDDEEKSDDEDEKSDDEDDVKSDDEDDSQKDEEDKDDSSLTSSGLSDDIYDYQVSIDGVVYQLPMWASDFAALGWEYQGDYEKSLYYDAYEYDYWTKDGMEIWTEITNFSINSTPLKDCLITDIEIDEYSLPEGQECEFANGIKLNVSTQEDIIAAYGEPTEIYDGYYTYLTYSDEDWVKEIEFAVDDNILISVDMLNEFELDGFDNTFYDERPSFIDDYKAPTEMGSELFDAILQLDGEYYSLPCPVQEFLDNGFEFDYYYYEYDDFICSGDYIYCDLKYGDKVLDVTIRNFSEYATAKENCYVVGITDVSNDSNDWNMEIFGGLKNGSTEDELLAVIGELDYNLYEGTDYNSYTIYADEWEYTNSLYFMTRDGIIEQISIFNEEHPENK